MSTEILYRPCPRCGCRQTIRWGHYAGGQRFRCNCCKRTFTPRTGGPRAYTKRPDDWAAYLELMERRATLREIAETLGIHLNTAFRWRHALLRQMAGMPQPKLTGPVELGAIPFAFNEKGSRDTGCEPQRRGGRWTGMVETGRDRTHVLVALSPGEGVRTRHVEEYVVGVSSARLFVEQSIAPGQKVVVGGWPWRSTFEGIVRRSGCELYAAPRTGDIRAPHLQAYRRRLNHWLAPFRGVGTRYLHEYLRWHLAVEMTPPDAEALPVSGWRRTLAMDLHDGHPHVCHEPPLV